MCSGKAPKCATIQALEQASPDKLHLHMVTDPGRSFPEGQDLMLISIEGWKRAVEKQSAWLAAAPSTLIMRP